MNVEDATLKQTKKYSCPLLRNNKTISIQNFTLANSSSWKVRGSILTREKRRRASRFENCLLALSDSSPGRRWKRRAFRAGDAGPSAKGKTTSRHCLHRSRAKVSSFAPINPSFLSFPIPQVSRRRDSFRMAVASVAARSQELLCSPDVITGYLSPFFSSTETNREKEKERERERERERKRSAFLLFP